MWPRARRGEILKGHQSHDLRPGVFAGRQDAGFRRRRQDDSAVGREKGQTRRTLEGHTSDVYRSPFPPRAIGWPVPVRTKTIRLWNVHDGTATVFKGHRDPVYSVVFFADSSRFASASDDGTVRLWDVKTGRELGAIQQAGAVYAVTVTADGKTAASSGASRRSASGSSQTITRTANSSHGLRKEKRT